MQRWEYLTIAVDGMTWSDSLGRTGRLPDFGDAGAFQNELGEQGWELSGVHGCDNFYRYRLFLKRPRS
jgi:hypothetical protein